MPNLLLNSCDKPPLDRLKAVRVGKGTTQPQITSPGPS